MNLTTYSRRKAHEVNIGGVKIGSSHPIQVQSMTNTPTADTVSSVEQVKRIADAGAPIVRLTAQGRKEGENLENIVARLREDGYPTAIVADIHFDYRLAIQCIENGIDPENAEDVILIAEKRGTDIKEALSEVLEKYPFFASGTQKKITTGVHISAAPSSAVSGVEAAFRRSNPNVRL